MADEKTPAPKKRALSIAGPKLRLVLSLKKMMATLQESMNQVIIRLEQIEEREDI